MYCPLSSSHTITGPLWTNSIACHSIVAQKRGHTYVLEKSSYRLFAETRQYRKRPILFPRSAPSLMNHVTQRYHRSVPGTPYTTTKTIRPPYGTITAAETRYRFAPSALNERCETTALTHCSKSWVERLNYISPDSYTCGPKASGILTLLKHNCVIFYVILPRLVFTEALLFFWGENKERYFVIWSSPKNAFRIL